MRLGIRTQVLLALAAVLIFGLMASYLITVGIVRGALVEQRADALQRSVALSARYLESHITAGDAPDTVLSALPSLSKPGEMVVVDPDSEVIDVPGGEALQTRVGWEILERARAQPGVAFVHELTNDSLFLVIASSFGSKDVPKTLIVVQQLTDLREELARVERLFALFSGFILVLAILIGYFLLGRAVLKPVQRLNKRVERIGDGAFATGRITDPPAGELGDLMKAFEQLVERLEDDAAHIQRQLSELQLANREIATQHEQLIRTGKLASVGELAAGVAHEIGNPIAVLQGYIEMLTDPSLDDAQRRSYLVIMEDAVGRVGTIIRDLLDFARPEADIAMHGDVLLAVESVIKLIEPQKRMRHVTLAFETEMRAAPVGMPSARIEQILINLLLNAADASDAGGRIRLAVEQGEGACLVSVSDDGAGIAPEVVDRIFDPFYTTKDPGEGTGLGLSICFGLVERYGGEIAVESEVGVGTSFRIKLPSL